MMRSLKLTLLLGSLAAASLIVVGWLGSDARALQQLRRREHLNSPEAVFHWVTRHYRQALHTDPVMPGPACKASCIGPAGGCGAMRARS
jgi:hypothetical protein